LERLTSDRALLTLFSCVALVVAAVRTTKGPVQPTVT
jgi:hypothetical protein